MSRLLLLLCLVVVGSAAPAVGQPADRASTAAPATAPVISAAQARQALDVLNDPGKRAQFIATLEAIVKAQPVAVAPSEGASATAAQAPTAAATPPATPSPTAPAYTPLAPNGLGAVVLVRATDFLNHVSQESVAALTAVRSLPLLWAWVYVMATNPVGQAALLDTGWRLALVMVIGIAVEWALTRAVRRPILAMAKRAPNGGATPEETGVARAEQGETEPPNRRRLAMVTLLRRVPLVIARLVLELLPVVGFLLIGHFIAASPLGGSDLSRLVLLAVIAAYAVCAAIVCVARMMFSPNEPRLRLLHISDDQAAYATRWTGRITAVAVFGYVIAEVSLLLGLSVEAHDVLLKTVGLIVHVFLAIVVLQCRRTVRRWLRAPQGSTGLIAVARNWLARTWHWIAIFMLVALWLVSAVEIPHGYSLALRFLASAIVVAVVARLVQIVILGALDRLLRVKPDTAERYPGIETRLAMYYPVLVSTARGLIFLASAIVLLQLWGLGTLDWLVITPLGHRLLSSIITLAVTLLLALTVWEAVNAGIERHLAKLTREAQVARSARLRTLLPLFRSALLITILIVVGMMVLSEIGVNIGPLLAGAGIIGVAIGFGSQKLVQDLITGIFLLLENAMQVGDLVTVSGLSGTVENLSVRTIRLRAGDGSVHVIPFSAVTTVTNVNRGIGNASVVACVAYHEDSDQVSDVLKEIAAGMRQEEEYSAKMLSDLQLWGVDKVDGASVTIAGQVVCTDSGRWSVQREFNRRMKKRFEEVGIEIYNPTSRMVTVSSTRGETALREADGHADKDTGPGVKDAGAGPVARTRGSDRG
jgi:moderate conductance mechanosensitive channel